MADVFYNKIRDYNFLSMSEDTADSIVIGYIPKACLMFECCDQDLNDRDDELQQFNYELNRTNKEILLNFMLIAYIDAEYICIPQMLRSRLTTSDFRSLNLHNQLTKVMELRNSLKSENDQLAINNIRILRFLI